eukprot:9143447-Heterocapsa_arctica.AAC.1
MRHPRSQGKPCGHWRLRSGVGGPRARRRCSLDHLWRRRPALAAPMRWVLSEAQAAGMHEPASTRASFGCA